jgi:hypothetical protein
VNDNLKKKTIFPKSLYYFSKPNNPRGLATILAEKQEQTGLTGTVFNSITAAYQKSIEET